MIISHAAHDVALPAFGARLDVAAMRAAGEIYSRGARRLTLSRFLKSAGRGDIADARKVRRAARRARMAVISRQSNVRRKIAEATIQYRQGPLAA